MDYSLLLYIVIKPYEEIKSNIHQAETEKELEVNQFRSIDMQTNKPKIQEYKPGPNAFRTGRNTLAVTPGSRDSKRLERAMKNAVGGKGDESQEVHTTVRRLSDVIDHENLKSVQELNNTTMQINSKTLFISESKAKQKTSKIGKNAGINKEKPVLVFKEKKDKKLRVYHICNVNDISNIKAIDQDEKKRVTMIQQHTSRFGDGQSEFDEDRNNYSKDSENFEEFFEKSGGHNTSQNFDFNFQTSRPSAAFFGRESVAGFQPGGGIAPGRASILNFRTSVSKHKLRERPTEYKITKDGNGSPEDYSKALEDKMKEIDKRLERECHNCKNGCKENHIIELSDCMEESNEDRDSSIDEPWKNISDTDVIEQVIFDPQLGMIKREIHFGIIDYITTFSLMKKIEEKIKGVIQDDQS